MAVVARKRKKGTVYYAVNEWRGRQTSELVGSSKREAEIRDRAMKREIKDGTYQPPVERAAVTVGEYADAWVKQRSNATAKNDRDSLRLYVEPRAWLTAMRMDEARPSDFDRLIRELRAETTAAGERRLSDKTIANLIGLLKVMFGAAVRAGVCIANPVNLARGTLDRAPKEETEIFSIAETIVLTRHHAIPWPIRVLNALCLLAGLREGEACGRRWRDLDDSPKPLPAMSVTSQYGGKKTKTRRSRVVPIHPELMRILTEWATEGFELHTGRKPTPDDFIVPNTSRRALSEHHTKSSYGHAFQRYREAAGVRHRKLHATRHTFITLCRRAGARAEIVERVTHNASGKIIDRYTHFDWAPLCEAVLHLNLDVHQDVHRVDANRGELSGSGKATERTFPGVYSQIPDPASGQLPGLLALDRQENSLSEKTRQEIRQDLERYREELRALNLTRKRRLLTLSEVDPDAAAPGLAACRGLEAAYRMGEGDQSAEAELVDQLTAEAVRRG